MRDNRKHDGEPKGDFLEQFSKDETVVISSRPDYGSDKEYIESKLEQSSSFDRKDVDWIEQVEGFENVYEAQHSVILYSDSLEELQYFFFPLDENDKLGMVENYFLNGFELENYPEVEITEGLENDIALEVKWMLEAEGEK